ncbi:MAG: hypothetical protein LBQ54_11155 [Planctomycetaceae bacterium]|nr:hypothetical protein [Planctomycetaceae bacterium]
MKIDKIEAFLVRLPLRQPFCWADQFIPYIDSVFLRTESDGLTGWGEVMPGNEPTLTAAWSHGVYLCLTECLLPRLGKNYLKTTGDDLDKLLEPIHENRHAKALLDMAFWDMQAKQENKPLHKIIGGVKDCLEIGLTFDRMNDIEDLLTAIRRAVDDGYRRVTLKIRPGWDLRMLSIVRAEFSTLMLQCDVEGALDMEKHSEIIYRFDDFFPTLLEQPISVYEYVGHAMLQDALKTAICMDESVTSLHQAEIVLDLRSASTICLKVGRVGGITEAKRIHDACKACDVACYSGFDLLTSVGFRFAAAVASLPNCTLPTDFLRWDEVFEEDPGVPLETELIPLPQKEQTSGSDTKMNRVAKLWTEPGIGLEPDRNILDKYTLEHFVWE